MISRTCGLVIPFDNFRRFMRLFARNEPLVAHAARATASSSTIGVRTRIKLSPMAGKEYASDCLSRANEQIRMARGWHHQQHEGHDGAATLGSALLHAAASLRRPGTPRAIRGAPREAA